MVLRAGSLSSLFEFVKVFGQFEHDLVAAILVLNDDAGDADAVLLADLVKLTAVVTIFEEPLEGQHTARDVYIGVFNACLGKSLFHRGAAGSMRAGKHDDLFHKIGSFY